VCDGLQVAAGDYDAAMATFAATYSLIGQYSTGVDAYNFMFFNRLDAPISRRALQLDNGEYNTGYCAPTPMTCGSLLVPRTHNKLGDRSFSAAGPRLWNDLPPGLRRPGLTFLLLQTISENSFIWRPKRLVTVLNL